MKFGFISIDRGKHQFASATRVRVKEKGRRERQKHSLDHFLLHLLIMICRVGRGSYLSPSNPSIQLAHYHGEERGEDRGSETGRGGEGGEGGRERGGGFVYTRIYDKRAFIFWYLYQ